MEPKGIEPSTSWLQTRESTDTSGDGKALTPTPSPVCTRVCTSEPENANTDPADTALLATSQADVESHEAPRLNPQSVSANRDGNGEGIDQADTLGALAAVLLALSPADRAKLAAMLVGKHGKDEQKTD